MAEQRTPVDVDVDVDENLKYSESAMSGRRELSFRLNAVLEMVGVTEEMRRYHRRWATMYEILKMVSIKSNTGKLNNLFLCGSTWEGTVTPDLASDVDTIQCPSDLLVVPRRQMLGLGEFLYAFRETWTLPGYVKLQLMWDGRPVTVYDIECDQLRFDGQGRACLKHVTHGTMHGPASMFVDEQGQHYEDQVYAYQCKCIPHFATDWITRFRKHDWPSKLLIDELKMMGCIFVGVGHFESQENELEWRLSFSLQERVLMKNLNITQHRVYVIMKMIKRDILERCLNEESLSSYHFKTCLFYMAESTPARIWVPENLINCLLRCLALILRWLKNRFCPSFFLKDVNLFDKKGFLRLTEPLERLIALLLQTVQMFLYWLQSDNVGEMLRGGELVSYKPVTCSRTDKYILKEQLKTIDHIIKTCRSVQKHCNSAPDSLALYMTELETLQHGGEIIPYYTEEEYRAALSHALPWLHLSIGLEFAARAVSCQDKHERKVLNSKADYHLQKARSAAIVNVRLAKATIMLRQVKLDECFLLLQDLYNYWTFRCHTRCPCKDRGIILYEDEAHYCEIAAECRGMSLRKLLRTRIVSCATFDRSQMELVPPPLRYEMYRSLFTRPGSRHELNDAWFDRAAVDADVYIYLLQYMVCSKLNMEPGIQIAIYNLTTVTLHGVKKIHFHSETAFNLLGWVYMQEQRIADAEQCFLQSWKIRTGHNAAKFHMLDLCLRLKKVRRRQQNDI